MMNTPNQFISITTVLLLTLLVGCSDSSDDAPAVDLSGTDDLQLRQTAAQNALESLTQSLSNTARLSDDPIPVLDSQTLDPLTDDNVTGMSNNEEDVDQLNTESDDLLTASLGLEDNSQATVTQTGNLITIDPDDAQLCQRELENMAENQQAFEVCLALAADLIIEIKAQTEEIGRIDFLFRGESLLAINYAPMSSSYELDLSGLKIYFDALAEITSADSETPVIMEGVIRVSSAIDAEDPDAGSLALDVTQPVRIEDTVDGSLSISPGTLLSVSTFPGTGNGTIEMNMGAIGFQLSDPESQSTAQFNMAGLTARVELTRDGHVLRMSNLSLGRGPLTVTVNSVEQIRMTLETLGFTISESDGELLLDTNLDLSLFLRTESDDDNGLFSSIVTETQLDLSAVAGTGLLGQIASTMVTQGGPFNIDIMQTTDAMTSGTTSLSVSAGQCFGETEDDELELLPCDP